MAFAAICNICRLSLLEYARDNYMKMTVEICYDALCIAKCEAKRSKIKDQRSKIRRNKKSYIGMHSRKIYEYILEFNPGAKIFEWR